MLERMNSLLYINYKKAKLFGTSIILLIKKFLLKITKVNLNRSIKKIK